MIQQFIALIKNPYFTGLDRLMGINVDYDMNYDIDYTCAFIGVEFSIHLYNLADSIGNIEVIVQKITADINWQIPLCEELQATPDFQKNLQKIQLFQNSIDGEFIKGKFELYHHHIFSPNTWTIENNCEFKSNGEYKFTDCDIDFFQKIITLK
jgi:hypothetical protein